MKKIKRVVLLIICVLFLSSCKKTIDMEYYCNEGTLVENGKCKIVNSIEAEYTCKEDFTFNEESKMCEHILSMTAPYRYACVDGYYLENGKCISDIDYEKENGKCPNDTRLYNGKCKNIKYRIMAYDCPDGTLNEETKKCDLVDERKPDVINCKEGYEYNTKSKMCEVVSYEDALLREVSQ